MKAKEMRIPINVSLNPNSTMKDALLAFRSTGLTGIPVNSQNGRLIGMFTRDNLYDCLLQGTCLDTSIEKYYLRDITCFRKGKTSKCLTENVLPVIHDGKTEGAIWVLHDAREIAYKHNIKNEKNIKMVSLDDKLENCNDLFNLNGTKYTIDCFIGQSAIMEEVRSQALQASTSLSTVLICGESGTGKELLAQSIHNASDRFKRPFMKVNCAAIPEVLAEAVLFGYEAGAFTGDHRHIRPGIFELANGGTIFLDEVDKMPLTLQGRLLRVIQEKEIERVGGVRTIKINARIIAATSRDLYQLSKEGRFREELYYRLKVLDITIPPLRKHIEDIPFLLDYFLRKSNKKFGKQIHGVAKEAVEFISAYHWPGNIRELDKIFERVIASCCHNIIQIDDLGVTYWGQNKKFYQGSGIVLSEVTKKMAKEAEVKAIFNALIVTKGNKSRAAKLLGISRTTLYDKLKPQLSQQRSSR